MTTPFQHKAWVGRIAAGGGREYASHAIENHNLTASLGYYPAKNLGIYAQSSLETFKGHRDDQPSNATGKSMSVSLTWHLLNKYWGGLFIHHSRGFIVTDGPFPPAGTTYNFTSAYGVGLNFRIAHGKHAFLSWNDGHLSNGKGITAENPSLNSAHISLGLTFRLFPKKK